MKVYIDSEDFLYYLKHEQEQEKPTVPKKEDSIITKKVLIIFGIIAVIKIAILLTLYFTSIA